MRHQNDVWTVAANFTYDNSRIISDSAWPPTGGADLDNRVLSSAGKNAP